MNFSVFRSILSQIRGSKIHQHVNVLFFQKQSVLLLYCTVRRPPSKNTYLIFSCKNLTQASPQTA
jgi:hypothetical protein